MMEWRRRPLLVALAAGILAGCGERAAGESAEAKSSGRATAAAPPSPCPSVADMPDTVKLGDGGLAFGSGSVSRAAVVAKGRLYQASIDYFGLEDIGDRKNALIKVLELAIR
jgi:hypothetical protein